MDWLTALGHCRRENTSCVVVMVIHVAGSAPRTVGTRMLVTNKHVYGTIGGGALELEGITHARALMDCSLLSTTANQTVSTRAFNLGKELSQCCGGKVELQFDTHMANNFKLHVFGAGHVAQEITRLALRLPCITVFHDTRTDWLARIDDLVACDNNGNAAPQVSTCLMSTNTYEHVEALSPASYYLVMTHCHELDMEVVEAVLSRGDAAYCGLIASRSKATKFRHRLTRKGFCDEEIEQMTAPIGMGVNTGNTPMEVAIAGVSDVLSVRQRVVEEMAVI